MTAFPNVGLHGGVSNADYHASAPISSSALKTFDESPLKYKHQYIDGHKRKETPALALGSLIHSVVLEPDNLVNEYAVAPAADKRTKIGKELHAEHLALCKEKGLTSITEADLRKAVAVSDALHGDSLVAPLLVGGKAELSAVWADPTYGVLCKCRPDYWRESDGLIVDLKTTADAHPDAVERSIIDYGYALSAAWYVEGMKNLGYENVRFVHVFVEKEPPYNRSVIEMDEDWLRIGQRQWSRALKGLYGAKEWNSYPSHATQIIKISPPKWLKKKELGNEQ
ncbi:PD-(D/E)XK nuclease-like domain-containing protein [Ferrimonas balearica]|uniref:PD-(D/E)XK nuclease-like domain-containing protein n=1 Tax=Ferrimonas balearica TaxID=44012 RepID=UPI001C96E971|nr:PD-(D/E)XK nuclease-like domain-containing protein [Ferrimonas balearica]MBY6104981.1 PD-(D/E)XK nuclease-like domain-containing protein [Ferrimonas balearica]